MHIWALQARAHLSHQWVSSIYNMFEVFLGHPWFQLPANVLLWPTFHMKSCRQDKPFPWEELLGWSLVKKLSSCGWQAQCLQRKAGPSHWLERGHECAPDLTTHKFMVICCWACLILVLGLPVDQLHYLSECLFYLVRRKRKIEGLLSSAVMRGRRFRIQRNTLIFHTHFLTISYVQSGKGLRGWPLLRRWYYPDSLSRAVVGYGYARSFKGCKSSSKECISKSRDPSSRKIFFKLVSFDVAGFCTEGEDVW